MGHLKMTDVMKTLEDKQAEYKSKGVTRVKLGLTDIDGVIRGKYISVDKFFLFSKLTGVFAIVFLVGMSMMSFTQSQVTRAGNRDFLILGIVCLLKRKYG